MRSYPNPLLQSGQVKKSGVPVWIYPLTGKESGCLGGLTGGLKGSRHTQENGTRAFPNKGRGALQKAPRLSIPRDRKAILQNEQRSFLAKNFLNFDIL